MLSMADEWRSCGQPADSPWAAKFAVVAEQLLPSVCFVHPLGPSALYDQCSGMLILMPIDNVPNCKKWGLFN